MRPFTPRAKPPANPLDHSGWREWYDEVAAEREAFVNDEDLIDKVEVLDENFILDPAKARARYRQSAERRLQEHGQILNNDWIVGEDNLPDVPIPADLLAAFKETWGDLQVPAKLTMHPWWKCWSIFVKYRHPEAEQEVWTCAVLFREQGTPGKLPDDLQRINDGRYDYAHGMVGEAYTPNRRDFEFMRTMSDRNLWPQRHADRHRPYRSARGLTQKLLLKNRKEHETRKRNILNAVDDLVTHYSDQEYVKFNGGRRHKSYSSGKYPAEEKRQLPPTYTQDTAPAVLHMRHDTRRALDGNRANAQAQGEAMLADLMKPKDIVLAPVMNERKMRHDDASTVRALLEMVETKK
jgi:hypothetical protein